jgi:recombination protein RecA
MAKTKKENQEKGNLKEVIEDIQRKFGQGAIMKLKETPSVDVDAISTGCLSLDMILGVGGVPRGRVIEIYGPESSGKTSIALHIVAEAQKKGGSAAFIDVEHALDPDYAKKIGVNTDELLISQPDSAEQALQILEKLVSSGEIDIVVLDSVAALVPRAEVEGEMGDFQIGLQARLMSSALRKLTSTIARTKTAVIFLNQIRMKIGIMFGNPETTPGGLALKFYSSVRLELRKTVQIKNKDEIIGSRIRAKVVKNKVAPPFKTTEFNIYYNEGISYITDLIDLGVKYGIIKKSGAWFQFGDQKLGQGQEGAKQFLEQDKKIAQEIKKAILEKAKVQN